MQKHGCDRLLKLVPSEVLAKAESLHLVSIPAVVESLNACRMDTH
eukprot:SAG31_NODE_11100_length_1066_cov_1.214064_1_plen_44_part_01